jgi:hypothetical protein
MNAKRATATGTAVALILGLAAIAAPANATPTTHVVCVYRSGGWHERVRPRHCLFHRSSSCFCGSGEYSVSHLRWSAWRKTARGRGKLNFDYKASVPVRVTLWRRRWGWAPRRDVPYFTKIEFRWRVNGHRHKFSTTLDLPHGRNL